MRTDEEYNSKQKSVSDAIRFCKHNVLFGCGLMAYHIFIDKGYNTLVVLFILLLLDTISLYGKAKDELEKASSYMDSLKTREEYLSSELKRYHQYIEKKEKRKFVNL